MLRQEMAQGADEQRRVTIVASRQASADVVHQHLADYLAAMGAMQEIGTEFSGDNVGQMFVLGDRRHFRSIQAAHGNAVFQRNHGSTSQAVECKTPDHGPKP